MSLDTHIEIQTHVCVCVWVGRHGSTHGKACLSRCCGVRTHAIVCVCGGRLPRARDGVVVDCKNADA